MDTNKPAQWKDGRGNYVDRHWYGSVLQTEMQFVLTEEQARELLSVWRNKEWQNARGVKTFKQFWKDYDKKSWTYMLRDANARNCAGITNYRQEYGWVMHRSVSRWNDTTKRFEWMHTYSVCFHDSYKEMIKKCITM